MDHVIWVGRQILKLSSNFEMFIYFFVFYWIKKKDELLCNILIEIIQPFLYLEGASKYISQKKHNNKNLLIFDTNFNIQRPVQMTWSTHKYESWIISWNLSFSPKQKCSRIFSWGSICHFVTYVTKTILTKSKQTLHFVKKIVRIKYS